MILRRCGDPNPDRVEGILRECFEDIGADPNQIGFAGSPTMVKKIESITLTGTGFKEIPPTDEGIKDFVAELIDDHVW